MPKLSSHFRLGVSQPSLDFVDTHTERDLALFVDPFAISLRSDSWSNLCLDHLQSFVQRAIELIHAGNRTQASRILSGLREPKETGLGYGTRPRRGRGIGSDKALDLYRALARSHAATTGLLQDLGEFDLFIEGIGPDSLSDIATNIIKAPLIEYTQKQCRLWDIPMRDGVAIGRIWNIENKVWKSEYCTVPTLRDSPLLLVPKFTARRSLTLNSQEYYSKYVLDYLEAEETKRGSGLVHVLKNGERRIFKKDLKEKYTFSKDFLARFTSETPNVLEKYKSFYRNLPGGIGALTDADILDKFEEHFDERAFAQALSAELRLIPVGSEAATVYHRFMAGALEFLFYPNLIYPDVEREIHEGRKRIDILYTNAAVIGFLSRARSLPQFTSNYIPVECKNYGADPQNPELDQISGRFSRERGFLGILSCRAIANKPKFYKRCGDTAKDGRGLVIPLCDDDIHQMLSDVAEGRRAAIDGRIDSLARAALA